MHHLTGKRHWVCTLSLSSCIKRMEDIYHIRQHRDMALQEIKRLREALKIKMAGALAELRNVQQLEDALEQAKVCP